MGHCTEFDYMLWATATDLVMRYGPLHRMKRRIKICDNFALTLWAIAQDLVIRYGPYPGFAYPLWAVAKYLVKCNGL
jgi:hypothetical protein